MSNQSLETSVIDLQPAAPSLVQQKVGTAKPRCRHRVRAGAYCRLPVQDPKTGLCFRHASLRLQEIDSCDLSDELVCGIEEFRSPQDINHVLGKLLKLLAANKVSPRRGAVMAYTCNLLLRTLPAIEKQEDQDQEDQDRKDHTIILDIDSAVARRALEARRAEEVKRRQPAQPTQEEPS